MILIRLNSSNVKLCLLSIILFSNLTHAFLLSISIWKHLLNLVSDGKTTVIITTHYIDEARNSDTVRLRATEFKDR
jgi:hypothetical protein